MIISEPFLQQIFCVCTHDSQAFTPSIFKNIKFILDHCKRNVDEFPMLFKPKFELAEVMCSIRLNGKSKDVVLDNVYASPNFKDLKSYVEFIENKVLTDHEIKQYCAQIKIKKQLAVCIPDVRKLRKIAEDIESHDFVDQDFMVKEYDSLITSIFGNFSAEKRSDDVIELTKLDLKNDDYTSAVRQIEENYSRKNTIPTGFSQLDFYLNGGFEPGRVYIFAGSSGDGKSTMLINLIKNAITRKHVNSDEQHIYSYITLENHIDESLLRLYCCLVEKSIFDVMKNWKIEKVLMEKTFKEILASNNVILDMTYYMPCSVSMADISSYMEELKSRHPNAKIKGVYLDYLDLLKSGRSINEYRLELGQISIDMKVAATIFQCPFISVSQVNKTGYSSPIPGLESISESMKKVDNADFIGMMKAVYDEEGETKFGDVKSEVIPLNIFIEKNRSGPKHRSFQLRADFSKFKITDGKKNNIVPFEEVTILPGAIL